MTKSDLDRDSPVMSSSTMPSAKYSCSGSELRLVKGSTAIEGLSGSVRVGFSGSTVLSATAGPVPPCASRTGPTKRKPLRGSVLIRRCSLPESPIALRAAFRRVVNAASDTIPVADQVVEQVEYLWRDGDDVRPAMQLAPVSVECVLLEEIVQAANPSDGRGSSIGCNTKNKPSVRKM